MTSTSFNLDSSGLGCPENVKLAAIAVLVIAMHLGWLAWLSYKYDDNRPMAPPQRLHVQTVALAQSPPQKVMDQTSAPEMPVAEQPPAPKEEVLKEAPAAKEVPAAPVKPARTGSGKANVACCETQQATLALPLPVRKVSEKPQPPAKTPAPQAKSPPAVKPAAPALPPKVQPVKDAAADAAAARKKQLLADAKKSIEKMGAVPRTIKSGSQEAVAIAAPPTALTALHVDAFAGTSFTNTFDYHYDQELVNRLKRLLRLPQYGDVEIQLTLQRSGKVAKLIIVAGGNLANIEHVEKTVPAMQFPPFGNGFAGEEQHTFRVILSHERIR